jgi:hypothetical protein
MLVFDRPITTYVETNEMYSLALFLTSGQEVRTVTRRCTGNVTGTLEPVARRVCTATM